MQTLEKAYIKLAKLRTIEIPYLPVSGKPFEMYPSIRQKRYQELVSFIRGPLHGSEFCDVTYSSQKLVASICQIIKLRANLSIAWTRHIT